MHSRRLHLAVFEAAVLVLAVAGTASGQCTLGFDLDGGTSGFQGGGVVTKPIHAAISVNSTEGMSLAGRLFVSLPGACPATATDVLTSLRGAELAFPAAAPPVRISPRVLRAKVCDLSPAPDAGKPGLSASSHALLVWWGVAPGCFWLF